MKHPRGSVVFTVLNINESIHESKREKKLITFMCTLWDSSWSARERTKPKLNFWKYYFRLKNLIFDDMTVNISDCKRTRTPFSGTFTWEPVIIYCMVGKVGGGGGCRDKIYFIPLRLCNIPLIPLLGSHFSTIPLYSLSYNWSPSHPSENHVVPLKKILCTPLLSWQ